MIDRESRAALACTFDPRKRELLKQRRAAAQKELNGARGEQHG